MSAVARTQCFSQSSHLPESLTALHADELSRDTHFFSSRTLHLPTVSKLLVTVLLTVVLPYLFGQHGWPEPHREYIAYRQEEDERRQQSNNPDDIQAAVKATRASITPQCCHRLIANMPHNTNVVKKEP